MSEEKFTSRTGAIAAAAGSAVGLGNVWRFPYIAGEDGGAIFLLFYILFTVAISIPMLICEFSIGRMSGKPVTGAFQALRPGGKWQAIGVAGMLTAFIILSYYNIVSGWTVYYSAASVTGRLSGLSAAEVAQVFENVSSDPVSCLVWMCVVIGAVAFVVAKGVAGGIEKYSKILMPILFLLIVIMLVRALFLDGAGRGISFYLSPDMSKVTSKAIFDALGQSFFSLSIGMGIMTTYGAYIPKSQRLGGMAARVAILDFLVAFLSGAVIFPCVFAFGIAPNEGPGLVFVTLPNIFNQMAFGQVFQAVFFLLLMVAAITSSISLLEVVVAFLKNSFRLGRKMATVVASFLVLCFGTACALSSTVFNVFDKVTANVMMPLGALAVVLFVGWALPADRFKAELEADGKPFKLFKAMFFLVRYVLPLVIVVIFVNGIRAWMAA